MQVLIVGILFTVLHHYLEDIFISHFFFLLEYLRPSLLVERILAAI